MSASSYLSSRSVSNPGISSKQTFTCWIPSKGSAFCRFLRYTSNSVHGPYFMHGISLSVLSMPLETSQSFTSIRKVGLNREGTYLQFLLETGGLLRKGLNRAFMVFATKRDK